MTIRVPPPKRTVELTDERRRMFEDLERQVNAEAARQRDVALRMRLATPIGTGIDAHQERENSNGTVQGQDRRV